MMGKRHLFVGVFVFILVLAIIIVYFLLPRWNDNIGVFNISSKHEYKVDNSNYWIRIETLKIKAPITKNVDGENRKEYNDVLTRSLAHYKGSSLPDGNSNVFIFGHSSNDDDRGSYSNIFAKLNSLTKGDKITIFYGGKYYNYYVSEKKVVRSNDVSVLTQGDKKILTLMTCWPIGTKDKRLVVTATLDK